MDRIFQYIYYIFLALFVTFTVYLTTVLYFAPRSDKLERGFIPCTKALVFELSGCESGHLKCPLKLLWQDMKCNIGVIYSGVINWTKGQQATPWANYLFEPQLQATDEDNLYSGNAAEDMLSLEQQSIVLEQEQQESETAKQRYLNLDRDVFIFDPEDNTVKYPKLKPSEFENNDVRQGDIADEADILVEGAIEEANDTASGKKTIINRPDVLKNIYKVTDEKLQKGKFKNEK